MAKTPATTEFKPLMIRIDARMAKTIRTTYGWSWPQLTEWVEGVVAAEMFHQVDTIREEAEEDSRVPDVDLDGDYGDHSTPT